MKIRKHHSETTRHLNNALKALRAAEASITEARAALTAAGGGDIPAHLSAGTFEALFAFHRGRDYEGEPMPGGPTLIELAETCLQASAERDDEAAR